MHFNAFTRLLLRLEPPKISVFSVYSDKKAFSILVIFFGIVIYKQSLLIDFKILEELYNGLTPLMTAVMYGAPLITIRQMIELNPKSLSITSDINPFK